VDTKYEFGLRNGELVLIDEIHTPDSSRYFYAEGYETRQAQGAPQKQLSKEFVREWLMANDFMGLEGQEPPHMDDEFLGTVTQRYVELYERITGMDFAGDEHSDPLSRVADAVEAWLQQRRNQA
jgi:phosphoribosylaminoimidazole-succinocarboxamide synthase